MTDVPLIVNEANMLKLSKIDYELAEKFCHLKKIFLQVNFFLFIIKICLNLVINS